MRLFVAIELPERVRSAVDDLVGRWRSSLPKARWVAASNLHLTLAFLGEVDEARLPGLATGLTGAVAGRAGFQLHLRGSGCFPPNGRARVAWLGFAESPEVVDLHAAVGRALRAAVGHEPERRPFHPHLTVARCSPPWPAAANRRWSRAAESSVGEAFEVSSVALVRSRLGAGGAAYSILHRFALGGAA